MLGGLGTNSSKTFESSSANSFLDEDRTMNPTTIANTNINAPVNANRTVLSSPAAISSWLSVLHSGNTESCVQTTKFVPF